MGEIILVALIIIVIIVAFPRSRKTTINKTYLRFRHGRRLCLAVSCNIRNLPDGVSSDVIIESLNEPINEFLDGQITADAEAILKDKIEACINSYGGDTVGLVIKMHP